MINTVEVGSTKMTSKLETNSGDEQNCIHILNVTNAIELVIENYREMRLRMTRNNFTCSDS